MEISPQTKGGTADYKLRKVFGSKQIDDMLKQAKEITQSKQRGYALEIIKMKGRTHDEKRIYDEKSGLWYELQGDYYLLPLTARRRT